MGAKYKAAPVGAHVTVYGVDPPWVYVVRPSGSWYDERASDAPVRKMLGLTLDALYHARASALEAAAKVADSFDDGNAYEDRSRTAFAIAAAIRKMKETT